MIQEFDFQAYILRSRSQTGVPIPRIQNYAYIEDIERSRQMAERELLQRALNLGIHAWKLTQGRRIQTQSHDIPRSDRIAPLGRRLFPVPAHPDAAQTGPLTAPSHRSLRRR